MIRLSARIRRSASVASGWAVLYGCAPQLVDLPSTPAATHVTVQRGRPGFVVAAPPGPRDADTDAIAGEIARRTGFGLVVGPGVSPEVDGAERAGRLYEARVLEAAQGPLRFYAEIQGHDRGPCTGPIEIATVGIDRELVLRLRALAELIRDAHLRTNEEIERLAVLVEPADPVTYGASRAKREGILRLSPQGLHIELPRCARRDFRAAYAAILADFIGQAVALPAGSTR
jgi:hypothetical protein